MQKLYLKKREDKRIWGGHLWVYSNEVDTSRSSLKSFEKGELVELVNAENKTIGLAYVNPHSLICARLLNNHLEQTVDVAFFAQRLESAMRRREQFYSEPFYRWAFADSDFLPGLVVDRFDNNIVVQCNTAGMEVHKEAIVAAIQQHISDANIFWRADSSIREQEGLERYSEMVAGQWPESLRVVENGCEFFVDAEHGQKTGWFYDHRDNRRYLQSLAKGKSVLDVFSYVGGWGLQALAAGAEEAGFVDASKSAIALLEKNAERQGVQDKVNGYAGDAFEVLQQMITAGRSFDIVVADPPAFIKRKKDHKKGAQAYRKLNVLAAKLVSENGLLVSASCSMHWSQKELIDSVRNASAKTGRRFQLNQIMAQAADHPIHPAIAETQYLKAGFFNVVD